MEKLSIKIMIIAALTVITLVGLFSEPATGLSKAQWWMSFGISKGIAIISVLVIAYMVRQRDVKNYLDNLTED